MQNDKAMAEKTKRQLLEELLSELKLSCSITNDGGEVKVTLITGEGKEFTSFTCATEEVACEKAISLVHDAMICLELKRIFGDSLIGVMIVK